MNNYDVTEEDLRVFEKFVNISKEISDLYSMLYRLEVQGKKGQKEYNDILDYLKVQVEYEKKQCNEFLFTDRCLRLSKFLLDTEELGGFLSNNESMAEQDYNYKAIRRTLNILNDYVLSDKENLTKMLPDGLAEIIEKLGIDAERVISDSLNTTIYMRKALLNDQLNFYLLFLEEFINDEKYRFFREKLVKAKYYTSFIDRELEENMLRYNFVIDKSVYTGCKFMANVLDIDNNVCNTLENEYGLKLLVPQIASLLKIEDKDYKDENKIVNSILRQCFMRASLLFMTDETIGSQEYIFDLYIKQKKDGNLENKISQSLIKSVFKDKKKDKQKQRIIKLEIQME